MKIKINQGHVVALVIVAAIVVWMLLGAMKAPEPAEAGRPLSVDTEHFRVQVAHLQGQNLQPEVVVSAHTAAFRSVDVRTEIAGKVVAIHKPKGSTVQANELMIELDKRSWPARVEQAKANLQQRQIEADSAHKLAEKGLANEAQLALANTALANAKAELIQAQIQLAATEIRAPFAGIVDQQFVEVGDYVREVTTVTKVIDSTQWKVIAQIPEREIAKVPLHSQAWARTAQGQQVQGRIEFVAAEADPNTRTFLVEMQVQGTPFLGAGLTASLHIPQPETVAHFVSPALLVINEFGELGLKGVDENSRVKFFPIELLKADDTGIWVYGLPENAQVITVGQGFVEYGQRVEAVLKTATKAD